MSTEIRAQNSISLTSVKAIKDATDESQALLASMRQSALDAGTTLNGIYQDAKDAQTSADNAQASADSASEYASRAYANLSSVQSVAETLQWITAHGTMTLTTDIQLNPSHIYFVADQNGDYVVGGQHYAVVTEPNVADIATYYELTIDESLNNYVATHLVVDSEGLWIIPDAGGNKVLIATGQGSTYTSAGTYIIEKVNNVDTVLASFTASGAQIGTDEANIAITLDGITGVTNSSKVFDISLNDEPTAMWRTKLSNTVFDPAKQVVATLQNVVNNSTAQIIIKTQFGNVPTTVTVDNSVQQTVRIPIDTYTLLLDYGGEINHKQRWFAYWEDPSAMPARCYLEFSVKYREVIGQAPSFAFGSFGEEDVSGAYAFVEGLDARAEGQCAHAQNRGTVASSESQTAIGSFNEEDDADTYAFIIGNGTDDSARSNALTVDWDGNVVASGNATIDGTTETLDVYVDLPNYQTAGTTDKAIYDAIVALGWDSDVLIN